MAETTDSIGLPLPDEITITGINARGHHGVLQSERDAGQEFTVDLTLGVFVGDAASGDDLYKTVNYAHVAEAVVEVVEGPAVNLIETVAERIAAVILENELVSHVKVTVHKPSAPIPVPFGGVAVTVNRSRTNPARVQRPFVENGAPAVNDLPSWADVDVVGMEPEVVSPEVMDARTEQFEPVVGSPEPTNVESVEGKEPIASPVAMPIVTPFGAGAVAVSPVASIFESPEMPHTSEHQETQPEATPQAPIQDGSELTPQGAEESTIEGAGIEEFATAGTASEGFAVENSEPEVPAVDDLVVDEPVADSPAGEEFVAETPVAEGSLVEHAVEEGSAYVVPADEASDSDELEAEEPLVETSASEEASDLAASEVMEPTAGTHSSVFDLGRESTMDTAAGPTLSQLMGWTDDGPLDLSKPLFEQSSAAQLPPLPKPFFTPATPEEAPTTDDQPQADLASATDSAREEESSELFDAAERVEHAEPLQQAEVSEPEYSESSDAQAEIPQPAAEVTLLMERINRQIEIALGETPADDLSAQTPAAEVQDGDAEQDFELQLEQDSEPQPEQDFEPQLEQDFELKQDSEPQPEQDFVPHSDQASQPVEEDLDPFNSYAVTQAIPTVGSADAALEATFTRGGTAIFEPDPSARAAAPHAEASSGSGVFAALDIMDEVPSEPVRVVLAIGANLGDAQGTLNAAVNALRDTQGFTVIDVGPLARTAAVGGVEQPDFLNSVVIGTTSLSPRQLLHVTQAIELDHHRTREVHWGPRTLDIDVINYGQLVGTTDDLELPHPRAKERAFVLVPWDHVDPDAFLPGLGGGPVSALAATAPDREGIRWLALDWLTK